MGWREARSFGNLIEREVFVKIFDDIFMRILDDRVGGVGVSRFLRQAQRYQYGEKNDKDKR